jgi:8-amino-7-oxononanoate synthase
MRSKRPIPERPRRSVLPLLNAFHVKHSPDALDFLRDELESLELAGLRRRQAEATPHDALSFCSNDYLGLARTPSPPVASGAGASRLIAGEREEHRKAERAFAAFVDAEDALIFASGYAANVGTVSALAGPGDLILSDALNHASLIDGARLSRARVEVVPHRDVAAIDRALGGRKEGRAWVLVESYYSMDADTPDLEALRRICDAHGAALVVDEAHALGTLGPDGRGLCVSARIRPDVLVGTLGKAFGSQGAFVAGRSELREWLWNRARSFVFSTGLAPSAAAAATRALGTLRETHSLVRTLAHRAAQLRNGLVGAGVSPIGFGHVVPIVVGSSARAVRLSALLAEQGVVVPAIRPPTVPVGTARVRLTVTAAHSEADIARAIDAIVAAHRRLDA